MDTHLLTRKYLRAFDVMDADGSGELDEHDYALMGQRVADRLGHPAGSANGDRIRERYLDIWRNTLLPMVPDGRTGIGRDEFVAALLHLVEHDPSVVVGVAGGVSEVFLEVADRDADGQVSPDEFRTFLCGSFPSLTDADADAAFAHLDGDGDGVLSAEEFVGGTVGYWTSSDPESPTNWWIGPPPD